MEVAATVAAIAVAVAGPRGVRMVVVVRERGVW